MQILQGLLGMIAGVLILAFRPRIKDFTGDISFAEKWFGPGGTWTFFIILGVAVFVLSLMWATGSFQRFVSGTFGAFL